MIVPIDIPSNRNKKDNDREAKQPYVRQFEGECLEGVQDRHAYLFAKRAFDIVFSLFVLVAFCWLFVIIALLIKIDDPKGPIIFKQERVGRNGCTFQMHKFRSMCVDAEDKLVDLIALNEKTGPVFKIKRDPRATKIGYWLCKLSLASVIIGTPGDGESTKSLSRSANSSLDLQLCERRPGTSLDACFYYTSLLFLSTTVFRGSDPCSEAFCACLRCCVGWACLRVCPDGLRSCPSRQGLDGSCMIAGIPVSAPDRPDQSSVLNGIRKTDVSISVCLLTNEEAVERLRGKKSGLRPDFSRRGYRFVKRAFDIAASGAAIAVLLILGLILSIVICAKSPGASPSIPSRASVVCVRTAPIASFTCGSSVPWCPMPMRC